ncbi:MAG TPA: D-Ala-D-Ala carboxypeptidase family metallohydrolase, partial [Actinomycetes bacterium]|nr:D-Ala-D-Ala carboxypeptidase family metallohydrolase [Actinomycetes bacterium]
MSLTWSNEPMVEELRSPFAPAGLRYAEEQPGLELGHELMPPPAGIGQVAHESPEQSAVRQAIAAGTTDVNELTNRVFFARHPERGGRALSPSEPNFGALSTEWKTIRDTVVRPMLSTADTSDLWVPGAERVSNRRSGGTYVAGPWRFVFHTIEGEPSADAFRRLAAGHANPPHLWAMPSADLLLQTIPLNRSAYALARPDATQTNRLHAVQLEMWGHAANMAGASPAMLDWLADRVLAPVARMVPINLDNVRPPGGEYCYGTTSPCRMSAGEWNRFDGVCGHKDVPRNSHWDPGGLNMAAIAARAKAQLGRSCIRRENAVADHDGPGFISEWDTEPERVEHGGIAMTATSPSAGPAMAWAPPAGPQTGEAVWAPPDHELEDGRVEQGEFDAFFEHEGGTATAACVFPSGVRLRVVPGPSGPGQEHYDPNNSGEPLYDTSGAARSTQLAPNFIVSEFATSGGRPWDMARISCALVACLQRIRDHVGKPVTITSGYRSYKYNLELYERRGQKPTNSQHSSGRAADINISGMRGIDIAKLAMELCGTEIGVGVANTHAHVDVRGRYNRWTYLDDSAEDRRVKAELDAHRDRLRAGGGG